MVTASVRLTGLSWPSLHQLDHALAALAPGRFKNIWGRRSLYGLECPAIDEDLAATARLWH